MTKQSLDESVLSRREPGPHAVGHDALGRTPGTRPLVADHFAGGGLIPLEALRVGAQAFASDLNPIPVLLNKVALEYVPKYGQRLADELGRWGHAPVARIAEVLAALRVYRRREATAGTRVPTLGRAQRSEVG